jgi:lipopolysaccharide export system protein LptC
MSLALAPRQAEPAEGRALAFAAARRHSRRVRLMRRALEITVVGGIVALAVFSFYRNFVRTLGDISFEGVGIEGGRITMDKPHLTGSRPNGAGYNITAIKAMQDALHPGDVDLALIGGDIVSQDHEPSRLSANTGHYDSGAETLDLSGDVRLKNARYEIALRSVHIAFKKGNYVSKEPVWVRIVPDTTVTADSFTAVDNGAQVTFEGRVHTVINGKDAGPGGVAP